MTNHNDNNEYKDEKDIDEDLLLPHVFDGIQEYDNKLPNWWLMTLYGTIVFSIGYWFVYHVAEVGSSPEEKFAEAQARAAAHAEESGDSDFSDERLVAMSLDSERVGSGRSAYSSNCAACHGASGEGGIGPRLDDGDWVHGGQPSQILQVIKEGVPAKGMPAWGSVLGDRRNAEITAFIISLNPDAFEDIEEEAADDEVHL